MGDDADDQEQVVMPDTEHIRTILFCTANAVEALVLVTLLLDPTRPLGPVQGLLAVMLWVLALWMGWRK
jgi:hypothetical protein